MAKFSLQVCSDLDYEGMVVDVCTENYIVATLDCDSGVENTQIVFFDRMHEDPIYKFDFHAFMDILEKAFEKLKEVNPE